jgi:TP901 family phage tail tape measure protein
MTSASAVRAGLAFVEISADDSRFTAAMKRVHNRTAMMAASLRRIGTAATLGGVALGAPLVAAARSAATFEDALLELKASAIDISPKQFEAAREAALRMSREMGISATDSARAITLLVKAGMSVEEALDGAAEAAVQFATVSGVEAEQAATFMKVAMNVFGVSAKEAVDTLSAAADSSETNIAQMVEAFSQVGASGDKFGQTLFGVSQAMAAMARAGIMGEEAGTAIKTMLAKLVAPADDAKEALARMGLTVESFRDKATGKLLPIPQIAGVFERTLSKMSKSARDAILADEALVKVFDVRGLKVITAFADIGEKGFADIATQMERSRTVAEKFQIVMSGITGFMRALSAAGQMLAIGFGQSLTQTLGWLGPQIVTLADGLRRIMEACPLLSKLIAGLAVGMFMFGMASLFASAALYGITGGFKFILGSGKTIVKVIGSITKAVWGLAAAVAVLQFLKSPKVFLAMVIGGGALAAGAWWLLSGRKKPAKGGAKAGEPNGLERDKPGDPMAQPGDPVVSRKRGEALATLTGQVAGQFGIGPALNPIQETADNTRRMADQMERLAPNLPAPAALQNGMAAARNAGAAVGGRGENQLVNANERIAANSDRMVGLLKKLVETGMQNQMAFV